MKKILLASAFALFGTFAIANENDKKNDTFLNYDSKLLSLYLITPSVCEAGANAAYDSVKKDGGSDSMAQNAYNASLKACENQLKQNNNVEEKIDRIN